MVPHFNILKFVSIPSENVLSWTCEYLSLAVQEILCYRRFIVYGLNTRFTNENQIYTRHDPTFHGEAGLIREFCAKTSITDLHDYTLYSSCEPCFMCSGAMVWVKLGRLVYGASNSDLEAILGNEGCNCSKIVFG